MAAAKFVQSPITASHHLFPSQSSSSSTSSMKMIKTQRPLSGFATTNSYNKKFTEFGHRTLSIAKSAEQNLEFAVEEQSASRLLVQLKSQLYDALQGIERGIFGVQSAKRIEIEQVVKLLESHNPTPEPTIHLEKIAGKWKLIYSTITILGAKRTKLGLRGFITLGDFFQIINVTQGKAINVVKFNARGFSLLNGQLQIDASFKIVSQSRVDILYTSSSITPHQLMKIFEKKYDLLLSIFNPDGWHEITYVDDFLRIGRDYKGNIFILERA